MYSNFIRHCIVLSVALSAIVFCSAANAHPGHGFDLMAGISHPFLGLDHVLAMVAVGVWARQLGGRAVWLAPASFVALMALAGSVGVGGIALPVIESGIATSVLLLGLLIAFAVKVRPVPAAVIVASFAVFHGYSHGVEMPALAAAWQYGLGFLLATAMLHGLGLLLGGALRQRTLLLRAAGAVVAASGVWMMAAI
ncbi:MAG: HupE/UreJ family protein [Collimonas sp.]